MKAAGLASADVLKERLEMDLMEGAGLVKSAQSFRKRTIRLNTKERCAIFIFSFLGTFAYQTTALLNKNSIC
jgi:hypothetical protein